MPRKAPKTRKPKPPPKPKGKGGPSLYRPEYDAIVRNLVQINGSTISEIAEILSVSIATIYNWQARQPTFREALSIPQKVANQRVELSHYNECVGYFVEEEEIKVIDGKPLTVKKKVWQRPNVTAIIWWEKVKAGWRDDAELPPKSPVDDGATTIDETGNDTDKQFARRINFLYEKAQRGLGD